MLCSYFPTRDWSKGRSSHRLHHEVLALGRTTHSEHQALPLDQRTSSRAARPGSSRPTSSVESSRARVLSCVFKESQITGIQ